MNYSPQVTREHYYRGYDNKARWMDYWHQIQEVVKTEPKTVLEIGIGNGTVSEYLRKRGIAVTTVDIDPNLLPDYVCCVTNLDQVCNDRVFDTVLCAEVLEHLKFEDFDVALSQIRKVCGKYFVLTLPQLTIDLSISVKFPLLKQFNMVISIRYPSSHVRVSDEHYWEIGMKGYPSKKVIRKINKFFSLVYSYTIPEDRCSRLFLLKPRADPEIKL